MFVALYMSAWALVLNNNNAVAFGPYVYTSYEHCMIAGHRQYVQGKAIRAIGWNLYSCVGDESTISQADVDAFNNAAAK